MLFRSLTLSGYLRPIQEIHPIEGTLTAPLRRVTLPGKAGGLRYQLEISAVGGTHTAIIRDFESHTPEVKAAIQKMVVGSIVTMSFASRDFFTSPCDVWEIHTRDHEVLPLSASVAVKRAKEKQTLALSGLLAIVMALGSAIMILRSRRQPKIESRA